MSGGGLHAASGRVAQSIYLVAAVEATRFFFSGGRFVPVSIWGGVWVVAEYEQRQATSSMLLLLMLVAMLFCSWYESFVVKLRAARRVAAFCGRCCLSCGYDLRGCGDAGSCPECGAGYTVEGLLEINGYRAVGSSERHRLAICCPDGRRMVRVRDFAFLRSRFFAVSRVVSGIVLPLLVLKGLGVVGVTWSDSPWLCQGGVGGSLFVLFWAHEAWALRRSARVGRASGFRRCPACGEVLPKDGDRGICAGCGAAWTAEGLRRRWGDGVKLWRV